MKSLILVGLLMIGSTVKAEQGLLPVSVKSAVLRANLFPVRGVSGRKAGVLKLTLEVGADQRCADNLVSQVEMSSDQKEVALTFTHYTKEKCVKIINGPGSKVELQLTGIPPYAEILVNNPVYVQRQITH